RGGVCVGVCVCVCGVGCVCVCVCVCVNVCTICLLYVCKKVVSDLNLLKKCVVHTSWRFAWLIAFEYKEASSSYRLSGTGRAFIWLGSPVHLTTIWRMIRTERTVAGGVCVGR